MRERCQSGRPRVRRKLFAPELGGVLIVWRWGKSLSHGDFLRFNAYAGPRLQQNNSSALPLFVEPFDSLIVFVNLAMIGALKRAAGEQGPRLGGRHPR